MKIVTLSGEEKVTFKPFFTHKAERVFNEELSRNVVFERDDLGKLIAKKIPELNFERATEAALLTMIQSVEKGSETIPCTQDWLDNLPEKDYQKMTKVLGDVRKEATDKIEGGKKKD